jgi:hypothetical protein
VSAGEFVGLGVGLWRWAALVLVFCFSVVDFAEAASGQASPDSVLFASGERHSEAGESDWAGLAGWV